MEKRTLLAFALSFLVLLAWSALFAPTGERHAPQPTGSEQAGQKAEPKADPVREGAQTPAPPLPQAPETVQSAPAAPPAAAGAEVEREEIRVETPLYSAVWSTAGGVLKDFRLKRYKVGPEPGSPPVNLANLEGAPGGLLGLHFAPRSDGGPIMYTADKKALNLPPDSGPQELTLTARTGDGLVLRHTYRFHPDSYRIEVSSRVENQSKETVEGAVAAELRNIPPASRQSYYGFVGLAVLVDSEVEELKPKDLKKEQKRLSGPIGWMAFEDDYFMAAVVPQDADQGSFLGRTLPSGAINGFYFGPSVRLGPSEAVSSDFALYMGPRDLTVLKAFGEDLDKALSFGFTDVIAKPLLHALRFFNSYVHNYGFSIIILTVLIKILFWPLTHKSYKSMKEMQKIQPLMAKIREKYKDNKEQMNRELMQLYKTYKVNPMGGCLPMLIQIPVFLALFRILSSSIELRHAPFILWIDDLSSPDRLFTLPFDIPFMAPPAGIPVLTLLMGASMFFQQKMSPSPGDPTQAKIMMFLPLIFTFVFINFPSGLVLYWLTNNMLSIGQQYRILKQAG